MLIETTYKPGTSEGSGQFQKAREKGNLTHGRRLNRAALGSLEVGLSWFLVARYLGLHRSTTVYRSSTTSIISKFLDRNDTVRLSRSHLAFLNSIKTREVSDKDDFQAALNFISVPQKCFWL